MNFLREKNLFRLNTLIPSSQGMPEKFRRMNWVMCRLLSRLVCLINVLTKQFKTAEHLLPVVRYANKTIILFSLLTDKTISQKTIF